MGSGGTFRIGRRIWTPLELRLYLTLPTEVVISTSAYFNLPTYYLTYLLSNYLLPYLLLWYCWIPKTCSRATQGSITTWRISRISSHAAQLGPNLPLSTYFLLSTFFTGKSSPCTWPPARSMACWIQSISELVQVYSNRCLRCWRFNSVPVCICHVSA